MGKTRRLVRKVRKSLRIKKGKKTLRKGIRKTIRKITMRRRSSKKMRGGSRWWRGKGSDYGYSKFLKESDEFVNNIINHVEVDDHELDTKIKTENETKRLPKKYCDLAQALIYRMNMLLLIEEKKRDLIDKYKRVIKRIIGLCKNEDEELSIELNKYILDQETDVYDDPSLLHADSARRRSE